MISIREFADDFAGELKPGESAFTQNRIEFGVQWNNWQFAYVDRFDYLTEFTQDTATIHYANKNNLPLANRVYNASLNVERVRARGLKAGYRFQLSEQLSIRGAATYYFDMSDLQSGLASATGQLDPVDDQLIADANAIVDTLDNTNRDLTPLRNLLSGIEGSVLIDYAYDEPKFKEPEYAVPVIVGTPNPPISGVNFGSPDGTGYSLDLGVTWQPTEQLTLNLDLIDIANEFGWDNAPQTYATVNLNTTISDLLDVAQGFINGDVVRPNDVVERQLIVNIRNEDYNQRLPERIDLRARYELDQTISLFSWQPKLAVISQYYHTDFQAFPRLGIGLNENVSVMYDFGGDALYLDISGKYAFMKLILDDFDADKAQTFGLAVGVNFRF